MEIFTVKLKLVTSSANDIQRERERDQSNGQKLDTVTSFVSLGGDVSDDDSKLEVCLRIEQATAAYRVAAIFVR